MATDLESGATFAPDAALETPGAPLPPEPDAAADAEPDGVVEVQGRRMVDVSVVAAERRRVRDVTERTIREKEVAPALAAAREADDLRTALRDAQPYLNHLRQHPELLEPAAPTSQESQVTEAEARDEARDLELYAADGQPDVARARRIIARRRTEVQSAATQAAAAAIEPLTSQTANAASRNNFVQMATQGRGQVDPAVLAQLWAQLPHELTQHPQVGELVLNAAIGHSVRAAGGRSPAPPILSEPSGGRSGPAFQMTPLTRKIAHASGMSEQAFAAGAKGYRPNDINVLGD